METEKLSPHPYKLALKNFDNEVSVHGVFMDMITVSRDDKILGVVRERILNIINGRATY